MHTENAELGKELAALQQEYQQWIAEHGLNYREYLNPAPGSFLARYKARRDELNAILAPALQYWSAGK